MGNSGFSVSAIHMAIGYTVQIEWLMIDICCHVLIAYNEFLCGSDFEKIWINYWPCKYYEER